MRCARPAVLLVLYYTLCVGVFRTRVSVLGVPLLLEQASYNEPKTFILFTTFQHTNKLPFSRTPDSSLRDIHLEIYHLEHFRS